MNTYKGNQCSLWNVTYSNIGEVNLEIKSELIETTRNKLDINRHVFIQICLRGYFRAW